MPTQCEVHPPIFEPSLLRGHPSKSGKDRSLASKPVDNSVRSLYNEYVMVPVCGYIVQETDGETLWCVTSHSVFVFVFVFVFVSSVISCGVCNFFQSTSFFTSYTLHFEIIMLFLCYPMKIPLHRY